ncbi:MAG: transposase family protein [Clostridiales bacterium]|nr:transposase family protein [Clostridiales bacterium]
MTKSNRPDYRKVFINDSLAIKFDIDESYSIIACEMKNNELHIRLKIKDEIFECGNCGKGEAKINEAKEMTWRHVNLNSRKTFVHMRVPIVKCRSCGKSECWTPGWASKNGLFTLEFERQIKRMGNSCSVTQIAEALGENETQIWRTLNKVI